VPALHELSPVPRFFFARIFPWIVVAVGAFALYLGFETLYGGWASNAWPSVPGVVTSAEIEVQRGSGSSSGGAATDSYHGRVVYAYEVAGDSLTARRVNFGEYGTGESEHAEAIISRYPEGTEVVVHYDPGNPRDAVLEPGLHGIPWLYLVLGAPFFLCGLALARFLPRVAAHESGRTR
jgi:hypothetical protein